MDIVAVQAALRSTSPAAPAVDDLVDALEQFEEAVRRSAAAETEAAISRRASTLKATLKTATAVDRARNHLLSELRRAGEAQARQGLPEGRARLHLCG